GNVAEIDTALHQCLNRHEVLQSQHLSLLPMGIGEGTLSLRVGGLPISAFCRLLPSALTGVAGALASDGPTRPPNQSPMCAFVARGPLQSSERRPGPQARSQLPGGSPRRPCVDLGS